MEKSLKKMSSAVHSFPEFAELRKNAQGANSTITGSIIKSKRRHESKTKALNKMKK